MDTLRVWKNKNKNSGRKLPSNFCKSKTEKAKPKKLQSLKKVKTKESTHCVCEIRIKNTKENLGEKQRFKSKTKVQPLKSIYPKKDKKAQWNLLVSQRKKRTEPKNLK